MNPDCSLEGKQHFYDLAKNFDNGMLVTCSSSGLFHSRPMALLKASLDEGFWFISAVDAPKGTWAPQRNEYIYIQLLY